MGQVILDMDADFIDALYLSLVPVLLGEGKRLFDRLGSKQHKLERIKVVDAPDVTHLRFRIIR